MAEQQNPETTESLPAADTLPEMDKAGLEAAEKQARAEAKKLQKLDPTDLTDEQVDRLDALADYVDAIAAERGVREQQAQERAERAQKAAERLSPPETDEADADADAEGEDDDEADDTDPADAADTDVAPEGEQPQAIAAGGQKRRQTMQQRRIQRPASTSGEGLVTIIAAADVPGYSSGSELTKDQMAEAFIARSKAFPQGRASQRNQRSQLLVASIERDYSRTSGLSQANKDYGDDMALVAAAVDQTRLSGGGLIEARKDMPLVASGGWCAPSEVDYMVEADETTDGILDLPTVGITRGGLIFTPGPDFADIFASAGFTQTEAQAIAGDTKACVEVDCPDFDEVRLDAVGLCVKAPLLTNSAYPELVRRWISGTEVANEHKVAARILSAMETALGSTITPTLTGTPFAWSLLSAVELAILGQREARRLSLTVPLEVVLPHWAIGGLRADLANRQGVGADSVTDAQIRQHFADRGAAVQFVYNWHDLGSEKPTAYPSTVKFMTYPAGTFVRGNQSVVNLSTVYDTADLQTNVYTAAFVEDGVLVAKRKNGGALYQVPVNPTGQVGQANLNDPIFSAQS